MLFDTPPPFEPACDWAVNLHHCESELWHQTVGYVSVVVHVLGAVFGVFILWHRRYFWRRHQQHDIAANAARRYLPRPVDGMVMCFSIFLLTRAAFLLICAMDAAPRLAIREPLASLSFVWGYFGTLIFTAGVIETVSPVLASQRDHQWRVLPYQAVLAILCLLGVIVPPITSTTAWLAGRSADRGNWSHYLAWHEVTWIMWASVMLVIAIISACYFGALASLLRQQKSLYHQQSAMADHGSNAGNATVSAPIAAMTKHVRHSPTRPRASSISSATATCNTSVIAARSRTIRQLKRTLLLELILILTTSISASIGAFTKQQILLNLVSSRILELYTLMLCWPCFILAIFSRVYASTAHGSSSDRAMEVDGADSDPARPCMTRNASGSIYQSQLSSRMSRAELTYNMWSQEPPRG
ncbi:hypothetical protein SYNPS1DRAFT_25738 [Syncephalis pseudoplumigaleata]|uniref:Uncharacterized protein n=1 Tax=Syncephalis pseudoplumigaleata TaxID=1712513 RepID=A0A4P9YRN9_9FUNG|nr:hypothetical protein SYNPS1DRAFT_25738 [Syncephalis pseudoplumigaleata]|eukprot:RKP22497.1 hypothetical protein SYNPS1DRAFT_25738 [Syncephalis pseudoplumigaleata]